MWIFRFRLYPRVAREINLAKCKTVEGNSLKEEFIIMVIYKSDGPWDTKVATNNKLNNVLNLGGFNVCLLGIEALLLRLPKPVSATYFKE